MAFLVCSTKDLDFQCSVFIDIVIEKNLKNLLSYLTSFALG